MRPVAGAILAVVLMAVGSPSESRTHHGRELPDGPFPVVAGVTPIQDVNANDASGFSPLEFQTVTIEGVVQLGTGGIDPFDASGASTWFYVSDGTGGVAVAEAGQVVTPVSAGERVRVTGLVLTQGVVPLRGTRTIDLAFGGSVQSIGSGTTDSPTGITASQLLTDGAAWEGTRVRIGGLTLVDPGEWPGPGASGFVRVTGGADTVSLFVDDNTDLAGASPPLSAFDLIGFVAQDDDTPPLDSAHYLYPSSLADIIAGDGSGIVNVDPASVLQGASGLDLAFTLTGQEAVLESFEIEIPTPWSWSGDPNDLALSGPGFAPPAAVTFLPGPPVKVQVTGAVVTATEPGTLSIANLAAPDSVASYTFPARTATQGGTLTAIVASPAVSVITEASPGDVVLNELLPVTTASAASREEAEFVELFNRTGVDLDIGGWSLADIGRTDACALDARWAFPLGTVIPAGGYVVVCRTALDEQGPSPDDDEGFRVEFPDSVLQGAALFEMFDPPEEVDRMDDPATPNMVLLDPTGGDDQIALLGGPITNGGQCESPYVAGRLVPFAELVVLRDALGRVIDAVEYREIGPCSGDFCTSGITGPDDAYPFGAPPPRHSLGRDAQSTDTDSSSVDLLPASVPTPGFANVPGDTLAPALLLDPGGSPLSRSVLEVGFDEPVVADSAKYYSVTIPATGESVAVLDVLADPEEAGTVGAEHVGRRFFLVTEPIPADTTATLAVSGVRDLVIGPGGGNVLDTTATFVVPSQAATICDVQQFDAAGFSPLLGDTVLVAGFVTLGDIPPTVPGGDVPVTRVGIWVQDPRGCGANVFSFLPTDPVEFEEQFPDIREFGVVLDDFVQIRGRVEEFVSSSSGAGSVTEITALEGLEFYRFLARGLEGPEPVDVTTAEANDESLEGTLVHTQGTVINANSLAAWIDDGSGSVQVFQNFSSLDLTRFTVGDRLDVTGVITQFDSSEPFLSGYELVPQNQDAIFKIDGRFATDGPIVHVDRKVLVPELGESIEIFTRSPARSDMIVEIFDAVGRRVTTLYDGVGLGELRFRWNGTGQDGSVVDPGVYVCHVRAVALDGGSVRTAGAPIVVGLRLDGPVPGARIAR